MSSHHIPALHVICTLCCHSIFQHTNIGWRAETPPALHQGVRMVCRLLHSHTRCGVCREGLPSSQHIQWKRVNCSWAENGRQ